MHKGHACVKFSDGITNGAAWYVVEGGMQDWSYAYTSDMEVTIELGCRKYPDQSDLKSYWDENKGALLSYITQVGFFSFSQQDYHGAISTCYVYLIFRSFMVFVALSLIRKRTCHYRAQWSLCRVFNTMSPPTVMVTSSVCCHRVFIISPWKELGRDFKHSWEIILQRTSLSNRYLPETKQEILVGNQSSTYLEFKLKRQGQSSGDDEKKGSISRLVSSSSSHVQALYRQTKEFVLHQSLFLIISGIAGLLSPLDSSLHFFPFSSGSCRSLRHRCHLSPLLPRFIRPFQCWLPTIWTVDARGRRDSNEQTDERKKIAANTSSDVQWLRRWKWPNLVFIEDEESDDSLIRWLFSCSLLSALIAQWISPNYSKEGRLG